MSLSKGPTFPAYVIARYHREEEILTAFDRVEAAREGLQDATRQLMELIRRDPEWMQRWEAFLAAGGITCDELCRFMVQGRQIRIIKRHGHLRLISD